MSELKAMLTWSFLSECETPSEVMEILVSGETPLKSFKTLRDVATFTNKRIIVKDAQGLTGKKVEVYSLPYSSINMWSSENAGRLLDINSEIELWTRAGHIKIKLNSKINIREFDKLISEAILLS